MPRFGVYLPTYAYPDEPAPSAASLQDYARIAEDLGFDGVWVFDHLLEAPPSYKAAFLEPATSLVLAALATRRVDDRDRHSRLAPARPGPDRQDVRQH